MIRATRCAKLGQLSGRRGGQPQSVLPPMQPSQPRDPQPFSEQASLGFREAALLLLSADVGADRLVALQALGSDQGRAAAAWECAHAFLAAREDRLDEQGSMGHEEASRLVGILSQGTPSQMSELVERLAGSTIPLTESASVRAEAAGHHEELRLEWFRALLSEDAGERLKASELITCAPLGSLSGKEAMALARYLFRQAAEDQGALLLGAAAQPAHAGNLYVWSGDRIERFFARHAHPSALAVAEVAMQRNAMLSSVGARMLVLYGDQLHRDHVFDHTKQCGPVAPVKFSEWPAEALGGVEARIVELLEGADVAPATRLDSVRALRKLRRDERHDAIMIGQVRASPWDTELARAVADYLSAGRVGAGAIGYARSVLAPSGEGLLGRLGIKLPHSLYLFSRPLPGEVELSVRLLEASQDPGRRDAYERALSAWDVTGRYVVGSMRAWMASLLHPSSPLAASTIAGCGSEELQRATMAYGTDLLAFAERCPLEVALRISERALSHSHLRPDVVAQVADVIDAQWRGAAADMQALGIIVSQVVSFASRYPSAVVRMDLCTRFFSAIPFVPPSAIGDVRARLAKLEAEVAQSPMVVPSDELKAVRGLLERDAIRRICDDRGQ